MRRSAQPARSGGRGRCPREALLPSRKILALWATPSCAEHAQTPSGAPDASSSIGIFRRSRDSESSRENSDKIFDRFSPPGPSWSPNSAPKAVLCSSARRAASSYPWPSPRRRIERFALGASRYTQIVSLSTGEEFRCLSASANGPCARSSPSFSKVDERPRLARCCWKVV